MSNVLDHDLISRLVRATNDSKPEKNEGVLYGTVVDDGIRKYVRLDGSDGSVNTPVISTTDITAGDTVLVQLKNHTATVTGNITDPAIGTKRANGMVSKIEQTESSIRLYVANEITGISTTFEQRADGIETRITDEVSGLNTLITANAGSIKSLIEGQNGLSSRITQTEKGIETLVSDQNGLKSQIEQNTSGISTLVTNQTEFSEFKQTVEGFSFMGAGGSVKIRGGDIQLTGCITWSDLDDDLSVDMEKVSSDAASAASSANSAATSANSAATSASSASTSASNASKSATNASTAANNASNYASNASTYANRASEYANSASYQASQALANANSAAEAYTATNNIASSIKTNLPSYLQNTTINDVSLMSPIIMGGKFYAIGKNSWLEMESNGLRMYTGGTSVPKLSILNQNSVISMELGSGDNWGRSRFYIDKMATGVNMFYVTTNGETVGFMLHDDGYIYKYSGGTATKI